MPKEKTQWDRYRIAVKALSKLALADYKTQYGHAQTGPEFDAADRVYKKILKHRKELLTFIKQIHDENT